MNRAEQIRDRLAEIDAELAANPPHPVFSTVAYLLWKLDHDEAQRRAALIDERRFLVREYERLLHHAKED